MKRLLLLIPLLFVGCQKRNEDGSRVPGSMPGLATGVTTKYSGMLANTATTTVPVNAVLFTGDGIYAYLCMGAPCDVDNLPAQTCNQAGAALGFAPGWQSQVQCYVTTPCPQIIWSKSLDPNEETAIVQFIHNPFHEGYTSYSIKTVVLK